MTSSLPSHIEKYLSKFSLDKWSLEGDEKKYDVIIVVPALEEFSGIKRLINSLLKNDNQYLSKTLIVFVVNNLQDVTQEIKGDNQKALSYLRSIQAGTNRELENYRALNLGVVDASSDGMELPSKDGGVGLARKIGMDISLTKFNYQTNNNLLVCLDGDCEVETNYLEVLHKTSKENKPQGGYVNYEHPMPEEDDLRQAIICYEIFLRFYILGLSYAKSPYAFHTIGSTMFCTPESYVKIQGMNKRKAAEDFYFMEKLSKIAPIIAVGDTRVYPSNRSSWRVPFGTGQRVRRHLDKVQNEYLLYSFDSFRILKDWNTIFFQNDKLDPNYLLNEAKLISPSLFHFLVQQKFAESWKKILSETSNIEQISKQKRFWFDGFRTLKLIHFLRDEQYPLEPMFDVLDNAFKELNFDSLTRDKAEIVPPTQTQFKYLSILRQHY